MSEYTVNVEGFGPVRITFDPETGAMCIHLRDSDEHPVAGTVGLCQCGHCFRVTETVEVDVTKSGKIVGIEILT